MNTVEILNHYLHAAERRLKMFALSRGAAVTAILALALTVALCIVLNAFTFSPGVLLASRILLFLSLAVAIAFGAVMPLLKMNRRHAARRMEERYPEFQQRLLTFAERRDESNPFIGLLAAETADVAKHAATARVAPRNTFLTWLLSGTGAVVVLIWLIAAGPGYFGHGASLLWAGPSKNGPASLYDIVVTPGDQTVRRRSDQLITARLVGFDTKNVRLMAKFAGTSKWEEVMMQPAPGSNAYEFLFAALHDSVEYYVEARGFKSRSHNITVIDLPGIKGFKVTYRYPSWTGMKPATEDPGGDLHAVEGTIAELSVETEAPLKNAAVFIDDGSQVALAGEGTTLTAQVPIKKDGMYHFAAMDGVKPVRLSEDYFIEARADNLPAVKLTRPGRDAKVSPIEEVVLAVQAEDDYGLQDLKLHYSVNGGEEKVVDLLSRKGVKQAGGSTMIALEDFKLVPGDVVSVYATARDARNVSQTDMYFLEAQPYEREYSQSQQAGGGGGGGGEEEQPGQISARQKEIIAATWNQIKGKSTPQETAENARFLTEVQAKLRDQANSMSQRAKSRALAGVNQEFQAFVKSMDEAVKEMSAAAESLNKQNWKDALPAEQRALQHALRAESVFREIQVAFGRQGGGGGGGGAARDLDNLFDLELDTEKNQYETGQQTASSEQREKQIDEALQKLEQLARRQQELARQQQNQRQQSFQQRWEQEQLRREAEELRRKMEELQRGGQQGQQGQQSASSQQSGSQSSSSSSQSGQQGQQGQQSARGQQQNQQNQQNRLRQMSGQSPSEQRLKQAFDRLSQAAEDMRQAASQGDQSNAGARRAAERLQEAKDMLRGLRQQQSSNQLDDLAQRADELAAQQREFANKMRRTFGPGQGEQREPSLNRQQPNWSDLQQLAGEKDKMANDLERLERDTQKAARDLAGSQPAASSKLREGLGAIQQDEVRLRMKVSSQWIRQGRGSYLVPGEAVSAMALDKLSDAIKDARKALGENGGKQPDNETEKALARVERMREQLERAAAAQRGQQQGGQQPGGQQQGGQQQGGQQQGGQQQGGQQQGGQQQGGQQQGGQQQGGQQGGQQQGGQQQGGDQQGGQMGGPMGGSYRGGERWGSYGSINRGNLGDRPGDYPVGRGVDPERAFRETVRDLSQLRQSLGANSELGREISDILRDIQRSEYPLAGPELGTRLEREVLPAIEQLEMQLRRKLEGDTAATRTPSADKIPAGYGEKVADYFRRLSKSK